MPSFFFVIKAPRTFTLFPYTTLFRSGRMFGLTTTVVDPAALVHALAVTVTITLYIPARASVPVNSRHTWKSYAEPRFTDKLYVAPATAVVVRLSVAPTHSGPLLPGVG